MNNLIQKCISNSTQQGKFYLGKYLNSSNFLNTPLIQSFKTTLNNNYQIGRTDVVNYYNNAHSNNAHKIILTMLWGGITFNNFKKALSDISANANGIFTELDKIGKLTNFNQLQTIFQELESGNLKIKGVSTSFFTKIFQFYGMSKGWSKCPLIWDKWTQNAHIAILVSQNKLPRIKQCYKSVKKDPKNNQPSILPKKDFSAYKMFLEDMESCANDHSKTMVNLEESVFGWARDFNNLNNPRRILFDAYKNHLPI